jgi:hypothetical protein
VAFTAAQILTRFFSRRLPRAQIAMDFFDERAPFGSALAAACLLLACKLLGLCVFSLCLPSVHASVVSFVPSF